MREIMKGYFSFFISVCYILQAKALCQQCVSGYTVDSLLLYNISDMDRWVLAAWFACRSLLAWYHITWGKRMFSFICYWNYSRWLKACYYYLFNSIIPGGSKYQMSRQTVVIVTRFRRVWILLLGKQEGFRTVFCIVRNTLHDTYNFVDKAS